MQVADNGAEMRVAIRVEARSEEHCPLQPGLQYMQHTMHRKLPLEILSKIHFTGI